MKPTISASKVSYGPPVIVTAVFLRAFAILPLDTPHLLRGCMLTLRLYVRTFLRQPTETYKWWIFVADDEEVMSFRVKKTLKAELKKLADADKRKLAPYVVILLEEHIAAKKAAAKRK